jgi:UDP-N-acetyl-2-amino-2-deoxyglucuronate dehydrogenase
MKTDTVIGFGIVGTGVIADFHARAMGQVKGAQLRAVASRDPSQARAFASRHGTDAESDLTSLLARSDIDVVCVTTPSGLHEGIAVAALNAGKHVLCEKPLEVSTAGIDRMIAAAKLNARWLGAVLPARFGDGARAMKEAVEQERFGRLTLCSAQVKWWRNEEYYRSGRWRGTWSLDGGGALMNQGIHAVDLLQWLVGMPVAVSAFAATLKHQIEVEDTLSAILRFGHGGLGSIECATTCAPGAPRRIELCGTEGSAVLEEDNIVRWAFKDSRPGDAELSDAGRLSRGSSGAEDPRAIGLVGHTRVIADMVDAVRGNRPPLIDGVEGRKAVALIEAVYASARIHGSS